MQDHVTVETVGRVAVITLNRPQQRNAINAAIRSGLPKAMSAAERDDSVAVVVLTGADPAFCAGLDLVELGSGDNRSAVSIDDWKGSVRPWAPLTKPVIGAINGAAVTGGFELALNCDFLIASEHARFADTHARVGVMPGWGLTPLLADAVGVRRARQMSLSGNYIDAHTALTWGLVNEVVPHGELMARTMAVAADIAGNDRAGVERMLATYAEQERARLAHSWIIEGDASTAFRRQHRYGAETVEQRRASIIERGRSQI
ncbi:MAG: enoyl-CoA hydratase [Acidimicrobiales bacterium]|nr:enoyl-CoA hydratase [Acidimicrobiales bacterium]